MIQLFNSFLNSFEGFCKRFAHSVILIILIPIFFPLYWFNIINLKFKQDYEEIKEDE